jgi:hypothetical protein
MSKEGPDYRFTLRLPADLYDAVKRVAERQERSVHGQVVWCVKQCAEIQAEAERVERERWTKR